MTFSQQIEPHILSDDKYVRDFALKTIHTGRLGNEHTFSLAFQALDRIPIDPMVNPIIPYTKNLPITENVLQELIERIEREDGNEIWYASIISHASTELIAKYKERLQKFTNDEVVEQFIALLSMDSEQLFTELGEVIDALEKDWFNSQFNYGKRILHELIKRGEYDAENYQDIEAGIKEDLQADFFSYNSIFHVYLAGELKVASLVPTLASLLVREDEDILQEAVAQALIKIGTEAVIDEVDRYIQHEDTAYFAIDIVENIKHDRAEQCLLKHFNETDNVSIKTLLANALCKQLSTEAIPLVEKLMEDGYDSTLLELEEPLYANCVINKIDHPKLQEWKQQLIDKDRYWQDQKMKNLQPTIKEPTTTKQQKKVGRNDPCPCESGKKYKKCCGK
ncbi:SEC-C metal-binding domain-containing protein [Aquibacillus sediminis]|uniref:SEC-C metal-binding domain-containing protein n=1 Tax=Aquibacillus sediminis TaxID=2574734 RepID=UPI0024821D2C|nr:SEC-C metal-binding domain-containing protein [Aquibacillus sediminis]